MEIVTHHGGHGEHGEIKNLCDLRALFGLKSVPLCLQKNGIISVCSTQNL
jgi:hypothetical protein